MKTEQIFDVRGLSVLVTGAAGGIGFGYAEVMAANGARVTLADADAAALDAACARRPTSAGRHCSSPRRPRPTSPGRRSSSTLVP